MTNQGPDPLEVNCIFLLYFIPFEFQFYVIYIQIIQIR